MMVTRNVADPVFGEAERVLLDEAKARYEFEMRSAGTLHSKSTLFLTLSGVLAAFLSALMGRLLDKQFHLALEVIGLTTFALCLGLLTIAVFILGRSALSRSYQILAAPSLWVRRFVELKHTYQGVEDSDGKALAHLHFDLLDAWLEAAEQCAKVNEAKARQLEFVSVLLSISVLMSFFGLILVLLGRIVPL